MKDSFRIPQFMVGVILLGTCIVIFPVPQSKSWALVDRSMLNLQVDHLRVEYPNWNIVLVCCRGLKTVVSGHVNPPRRYRSPSKIHFASYPTC